MAKKKAGSESMHTAVKRVGLAKGNYENVKASKLKSSLSDAKKFKAHAKKKLKKANERASKSRSSSKRGVNQK